MRLQVHGYRSSAVGHDIGKLIPIFRIARNNAMVNATLFIFDQLRKATAKKKDIVFTEALLVEKLILLLPEGLYQLVIAKGVFDKEEYSSTCPHENIVTNLIFLCKFRDNRNDQKDFATLLKEETI